MLAPDPGSNSTTVLPPKRKANILVSLYFACPYAVKVEEFALQANMFDTLGHP